MNIFTRITAKNLWKNRTRTIVTIIGIALSAAMFTAVTTSVSTFTHYIQKYYEYKDGSWHGAGFSMSKEQVEALKQEDDVSQVVTLSELGFARLKGSQNAEKPYLCIYGVGSDICDLMPVHLTSGRMPENEHELLIPEHVRENGGVEFSLGETITLQVGSRSSEGYILSNQSAFLSEEDGEKEELIDVQEHSYTVVGFYERPSFEKYSAPGYTALTFLPDYKEMKEDGSFSTYHHVRVDSYFALDDLNTITEFGKEHSELFEGGATINSDYLHCFGLFANENVTRVLFGFAAILIVIIMFGSVSLIYNAFSISVSERTKQFGILSSIGATKKQLRHSVLSEGMMLAVIGIFLGILIGLAGIGITFYFIDDLMKEIIGVDVPVSLSFYPSMTALILSVVIAFITIMISVWIPAVRATRVSAIDAIRQTQDISIRAKKVKTSRLTLKLFGFEGMLATKYYKRNRKKYRATIISLFISIVLFISASSFCMYLEKTVEMNTHNANYDIRLGLSDSSFLNEDRIYEVEEKIGNVAGVTEVTGMIDTYEYVSLPVEKLDEKYRAYYEEIPEPGMFPEDALEGKSLLYCNFCVLPDDEFRKLLKENHIKSDGYFDEEHPKAVYINECRIWDDQEKKMKEVSPVKEAFDGKLIFFNACSVDGQNGKENNQESSGEFDNGIDGYTAVEFFCGEEIKKLPDTPFSYSQETLTFLLPLSGYQKLLTAAGPGMTPCVTQYRYETVYCINSDDHEKTVKELDKKVETLVVDGETSGYSIFDLQQTYEYERHMILIIHIFSYGFIILISLIAVANVFNTITTNVYLRRKDMAMLRSVGMTPAGFRKMTCFECILYGVKSLLYGLPVSFLATYGIYKVTELETHLTFTLPWGSVILAVCSVFFVVFLTMIYAMNKIQKDNTAETLRNEMT